MRIDQEGEVMIIYADRVSGYADALEAIEDKIMRMLLHASSEATPGLEVALATVRGSRGRVSAYHDYLCGLGEHVTRTPWDIWAETETECVPCLAETAPHTCLQA